MPARPIGVSDVSLKLARSRHYNGILAGRSSSPNIDNWLAIVGKDAQLYLLSTVHGLTASTARNHRHIDVHPAMAVIAPAANGLLQLFQLRNAKPLQGSQHDRVVATPKFVQSAPRECLVIGRQDRGVLYDTVALKAAHHLHQIIHVPTLTDSSHALVGDRPLQDPQLHHPS
ncbi:hypothetical protein BN946_scf184594.g5 [Trametes cinnabarina]|uniref:Uncharacterized protein n=1 Tax=Pycnoporus cinnabarinus TaxID=5643 RepID=A0A060SWM9_PYCCI|nr:hypothetical protein BN946_scf184594.g5 [Trametes cinnabarina]